MIKFECARVYCLVNRNSISNRLDITPSGNSISYFPLIIASEHSTCDYCARLDKGVNAPCIEKLCIHFT